MINQFELDFARPNVHPENALCINSGNLEQRGATGFDWNSLVFPSVDGKRVWEGGYPTDFISRDQC